MNSPEQDQPSDEIPALDEGLAQTLRTVAGYLIPQGHGMPSAADVLDDRQITLVLQSRPDLLRALRQSLRDALGGDPASRLAVLESEEVENLAALQTTIVGGYYMAPRVRDAMDYPGQIATPVSAFSYPQYIEEGLIDSVVERGPIWRDVEEESVRDTGG